MNAKNKRNQFLVEMHELEEKFRPALKVLRLSHHDENNLATIALNRILQFAEPFFDDYFFESFAGSFLIEFFLELAREEVKTLEAQKRVRPLYRSLQLFFRVGDISDYLNICTFVEISSFADWSEVLIESLANYIMLCGDISKEEVGCILATVKQEIEILADLDTAQLIIDGAVAILLENDFFEERIDALKILKK